MPFLAGKCCKELATLAVNQVVTELRGEGKSQRRVTAVHVIDVLYLGGEDLRRLHFMERQKQAALFLRVVNKSSRSDLVRMRMKAVFKLEVLFFCFRFSQSYRSAKL